MDNITHRKPIARAYSNSDLRDIYTEENSVCNSTLLDISSQSVPSQIENTSRNCNDVQGQLDNLTEQLESAHNEIMKLNSENYALKNKLDEKNKQIDLLKKLSTIDLNTSRDNNKCENTPLLKKIRNIVMSTPRTSPIHTSKVILWKNCSDSGKMNTPNTSQRHISDVTSRQSNIGSENMSSQTQYVSKYTETTINNSVQALKHCVVDPEKKGQRDEKPRIFIVGDQRMKGLALHIIKNRKNKWNDIYQTTAIVKPDATTSHILSAIDGTVLKEDDIVILGVGSNDENVCEIVTALNDYVHKLEKCNVLLLNVQTNQFVNIMLLNTLLHSFSKQHKNFKFIEFKARNKTPIDIYVICNKLNIEIDYLTYKDKFIDNFRKCYTEHQKQNCKLYKKGTIPYFFDLQNKRNQILTSKNVSKEFFRK